MTLRLARALLVLPLALPGCTSGAADSPPDSDPVVDTDPDGDAYQEGLYVFLAQQQHPDTGLLESFVTHGDLPPDFAAWLRDSRPSFVYDDALAALAWLARGRDEDLARATTVLDALVAVQRADGGVPDAVHVETLAPADRASTGNQAWVMLALLAGYERVGEARWLLAAERVAAFLLDPAQTMASPNGFGGYRLFPGSLGVSTEHNLDLNAAFGRLATHLPTSAGTLDAAAVALAARRARHFAESRFDPVTGLVYTGSDPDGVRPDASVVPLDTHTWSVLSLGRAKWIESLDWAMAAPPGGLWVDSAACPGVSGPSFSDADTSEVWAEGLAQVHAAARLVGRDVGPLEASLRTLQRDAPHTDGRGLVAACATLGTGFGSDYFDSLAVGTTAWAALASVRIDPFWSRPLDAGLAAHPLGALPTVRLSVPRDARVACPQTLPCRFTMVGTSTDVVGTDLDVRLLVYPTAPVTVGRFFTQVPATVASDGSWTVQAQLGDGITPVASGDRMRVVALVVEGDAPDPVLSAVTPDTVPGVVTTSGLVELEVE